MSLDASPFVRYLPDAFDLLCVFPLSFVYAFIVAEAAAWLRCSARWRTNYSRKFFHILVFGAAFVIGWLAPEPMHRVAAYGGGCAAFVILITMWPRHPSFSRVYDALAREQDEPHRTYHLLAPLAATALGGIATGILFAGFYQVGYLVAGLGDAVGEPVGVRFGRHKFRVPTLPGVTCYRSLEGSTAVLIASFLAAALALHSLDFTVAEVAAGATGAAALAALTEAVSPHGWDNLTTQFAACLGVYVSMEMVRGVS